MNKYSKWIVLLVILLNVWFLEFFLKPLMLELCFEPVTIINNWFRFTGVELLALATITIAKVVVDGKEKKEQGKEEIDGGNEGG